MEKITKDNFNEILSSRHPHIKLLSEYIDSKSNIRFLCNKCGNEYNYKPTVIVKNGCPNCSNKKIRLTTKEYNKRLSEKIGPYIYCIDEYVDMHTKIQHKCDKHNVIFVKNPMHALRSRGCPQCAEEAYNSHTSKRASNISEVALKVEEIFHGEIVVCKDYGNYKNNTSEIKCIHTMEDGTSHVFYSTANSLLNGSGCGVCRGLQVCVGYNDLNTTNNDIVKYLLHKDDGYKYTKFSSVKVDWKCPCCGDITNRQIRQVSRRGYSCTACGDGVSYPNKFIYNMLTQTQCDGMKIIREYSPSWGKFNYCGEEKTCRYDIYININGNEYIVEMDGGIGHGNHEMSSTKQESLDIDKIKDSLAENHGIKMIRIDSNYESYDRYEFIKNNIINSELSKIFDLSKVNFDEVNKRSCSSYITTCAELWNKGYKIKDIKNIVGLADATIIRHLKTATSMGLCKYKSGDGVTRNTNRKVICTDNNIVYNSIKSASEITGASISSISKCCRGLQSHGGRDFNGNITHWEYAVDA